MHARNPLDATKNYKLLPVTIQILTYFMLYSSLDMLCGPDGELPEKLRNLEPRLIEHVSNEIMDRDPNVRWDDIGKTRSFVLSLFTTVPLITELC